jgi:hypothetical protein
MLICSQVLVHMPVLHKGAHNTQGLFSLHRYTVSEYFVWTYIECVFIPAYNEEKHSESACRFNNAGCVRGPCSRWDTFWNSEA